MRRDKKRNKIIILLLIGIVCMMGVGYAAFQTKLDIKGNTEISSEWNIRIISAEVSKTNGSAENVKNNYNDLTADLEANLYSKGDYVEYKVIVENAGTFDAKLDTLGITNSNNEAVKITSSGLVKGQTLYKGETATLTVRIAYNENYEGDASGTSGETNVDLGFVQNSEGTITPTVDHLVTYDYTTNGGESTTAENEYVAEGESINLSYTATKKNYKFKGWNTNPQAAEGLTDLTMGTEDITLYAIFEAIDTTPPIIDSVNTTSTTNSITVAVSAHDDESGISKYEYSIDEGKTWVDGGSSNIYTFNNLLNNTEGESLLDIANVVTSGDGLYTDTYEEERYVYKGANPNNYITFNDETWRIISVESDGNIKIVRSETIGNRAFDSGNSNAWETSDIKEYLNGEYLTSITTNQGQIEPHTWSIGAVTYDNNDLADQISDENGTTWSGNIGIISASDYLRANTNTAQCATNMLNNNNRSTCLTTDWIYSIVPSGGYLWTISPDASDTRTVFYVDGDNFISGSLYNAIASLNLIGVAPTLYLKSNITLTGEGTEESPYVIEGEKKFPIKVRVTNGVGLNTTSETKEVALKYLATPTFSEDTVGIVKITYPEGCGDTLTCTYIKDGGNPVTVKSTQETVSFDYDGTLVATVSDGTNEVSSSYTIIVSEKVFTYTGDFQTYTIPKDGYYKIELWGAQSGTGSETVANGKGSYTSGEIYLKKGTKLYVYVGPEGDDSEVCKTVGLFNNGGIVSNNGNGKCGVTGGGATDIRLTSGDWNNEESLRSRIMVAAGGSFRTDGGDLVGKEAYNSSHEYYPYIGKRGTQTSGGIAPTKYSVAISNGTVGGFGYAGNGGASMATSSTGGGSTGGSGYYGGSGGSGLANGSFAGGSGSSYISGYAGVNSITSESSEKHTNQTIHYSGKYFINTTMTAGVNDGNGKAIVTYIGTPSSEDSKKIEKVRYIKDCTNGTTHDNTNQWIEIQAINHGKNVAKGATVTSTSTAEGEKYISYVVDGIMDNTSQFFQPSGDNTQCVTVDLGQEYDLEEIGVWHYYVDRSSNENVTSVAGNDGIYRTIYNNSQVESSNGNHIKS